LKIKKEVKIGLIVIAGIFLLVYGLNFLKGKNIFDGRNKYYVVYDNVGGLTISNPVYYNGFVVGRVNKISFLNDQSGRMSVEISLRETDLRIPRGSVARIFSDGLLGTKAISIDFSKEKTFLEDGDTLKPDLQASITDEVARQVKPLKDKAESLISTVDTLIQEITSIFNDGTKGSLRHSMQNMDEITGEFKGLVIEERTKLKKIMENIESISNNLKNNNEAITGLLKNLNNLSDTLVRANVAQTISNANIALLQMSEVMKKINSGQGSLGLLVNDDKLYKNLESTSKDLDQLMIDLKANPGRYVHFSLFGRKDKQRKQEPKSIKN
jgi:phospholipid/cholesterol/gamma-HCH transport system substrate-binding protein